MGFLDDVSKGINVAARVAQDMAKDVEKGVQDRRIEKAQAEEFGRQEENKLRELAKNVVVTTGDIKQDYEIIRPIFFQVSNKGVFSNKFKKLAEKYAEDIKDLEQNNNTLLGALGQRLIIGWSVQEDNFEKAFYMAVEELKRKAIVLGANAIIHMRQDIDLDTDGFAFFYLQMYGTAVKLKEF